MTAPDVRTPGGNRASAEQNTADATILPAADAERKAFARVAAEAALCGCTLHELAGGGFLLCRWGLSRELPCLRAVGDMLRRIGGRP